MYTYNIQYVTYAQVSLTYVRTCTTHTYVHIVRRYSHTYVYAHILYTCVDICTYVCIAQTTLSELVNIQTYVRMHCMHTQLLNMYVRTYV